MTGEILGFVGLSLILIAFILNETNYFTSRTKSYNFMNFVGALLLIYYSYLLESIPFMILQTVWALISIYELIKK